MADVAAVRHHDSPPFSDWECDRNAPNHKRHMPLQNYHWLPMQRCMWWVHFSHSNRVSCGTRPAWAIGETGGSIPSTLLSDRFIRDGGHPLISVVRLKRLFSSTRPSAFAPLPLEPRLPTAPSF